MRKSLATTVIAFVACTLRSVGLLGLVTAMAIAMACGDSGVSNPAAPSATGPSGISPTSAGDGESLLVSLGQEKTTICHRHPQTGAFTPVSLPATVIDAHLAHGDGRVGDSVPGRDGTIFDEMCVPTQGLLPGDTLEIRFYLPGPPDQLMYPNGVLADVDIFHASISNTSQLLILSPVVSHTAELFDGSVSLGTITNTFGGASTGYANLEAGNWKSPSSLFYSGSPERDLVIDFSSFVDGSIDGRLQFQIASGSMLVDIDTLLPSFAIGLGFRGTWGITNVQPVISQISIIPKP